MEPVSKTQLIRVADVVFIGPAMIYGGDLLYKKGDKVIGQTLVALGTLTMIYNGLNWWEQNQSALRQPSGSL
jgi:hypothetical protein